MTTVSHQTSSAPVVARALLNRRRIALLRQLEAVDGPVPIDVLSEWIVANDDPETEMAAPDTQQSRLLLTHVDLPYLEDLEVVEVDQETHSVEIADVPVLPELLRTCDRLLEQVAQLEGKLAN